MSIEDRVRDVFVAVFGVPADAVDPSITQQTFSPWDSLKHVTLVLALENEFGFRFDDDEYGQLDSFQSIASVIRGKADVS